MIFLLCGVRRRRRHLLFIFQFLIYADIIYFFYFLKSFIKSFVKGCRLIYYLNFASTLGWYFSFLLFFSTYFLQYNFNIREQMKIFFTLIIIFFLRWKMTNYSIQRRHLCVLLDRQLGRRRRLEKFLSVWNFNLSPLFLKELFNFVCYFGQIRVNIKSAFILICIVAFALILIDTRLNFPKLLSLLFIWNIFWIWLE